MTSELLPILREKGAPMGLCGICPVPGACCKGFVLTIPGEGDRREEDRNAPTFWLDRWREDARAWAVEREYGFVPAQIEATYRDEESGKEYVAVRWDCTHLTQEGRCGIYETRPPVCRQYLPLENELCRFPR